VNDSFDPYRKWLGIPPEEQPPHHYRLLGLELFEEDPDVIVNAADSRLSFLQSLVKDKNADMADRLSAQIKEVQSCLLDPAKKAFYDGQLQRRIAASKKESPTTSGMGVPSAIMPENPSAEFAIPELHVPAYSQLTASSPRKRWHLIAAMLFGLAALGCLLVFLLVKTKSADETIPTGTVARSNSGSEKSGKTETAPNATRDNTTANNLAAKPENPLDDSTEDSSRGNGSMPSPDGSHPSKSRADLGENPFLQTPLNNSETGQSRNVEDPPPKNSNSDFRNETNLEMQGGNEDEPPISRQLSDKRQPIPTDADAQAAEKSIRKSYALNISAAQSGFEKIALSTRIWTQALENRGDLTAQYAMMSVAFQLACDSGQLQRAMNRADSFANYFDVNPWDLKFLAIGKTIKAALAAQTTRTNPLKINGDEVVLICRQFAEEAKEAGEIEIADKTVKAVMPLAKKDPMLMRDINVFGQEIKRLAARYQPVRKALDTLKEKPDDADANALAGRWTCFESHDWDKGLSMLAKSSDAPLADLAKRDITVPKDAAQQLAIADEWWDYAQKEKGSIKAGALLRAEHWYDSVSSNLTGLNKARADARLKTISGIDATAASGRGVIQTGNIALAKNGTHVEGIQNNEYKLLDGDSKNPSWDSGGASSPVPCEWTITFDKVYQLQLIRFHFYDGDRRFYNYWLEASADGTSNWKRIYDCTQRQGFQWQNIPLSGIPVKAVRLHGTFSYRNNPFSVTEFEAYCIPPKP
jgi:hypothetical protein